ncbi:MAG: SDR family NAD(P)-dependent oxidoreductase [Gemmatimonadota bacterium]|jgi:short-subunit dehydrogenase involved in D-alanine esterification of teichoic acids
MRIDGRTVLVTGGSRGIGLELARTLAERGARVAVCSRGERAPAALEAFGERARHFTCDLSKPDEVMALADRVRDEFGAPGVLINNAGVQFNHDWAGTDAEDRARWARTELTVNLLAPTLLTSLFLDDLRRHDPGVVVNVTSLLALAPKRSAPVYSASKAGLRSLTRALRGQLAGEESVRFVEVVPPLVDTAMTAGRGSGKMDPAEVARRIVEGLEAERTAIRIGFARVMHGLWIVTPGLAGALLERG